MMGPEVDRTIRLGSHAIMAGAPQRRSFHGPAHYSPIDLTEQTPMRIQLSREDLIAITQLNPFERFPDGRPRVPDDLLERMKLVTTEEAWGVLRRHGYHRQFEGN